MVWSSKLRLLLAYCCCRCAPYSNPTQQEESHGMCLHLQVSLWDGANSFGVCGSGGSHRIVSLLGTLVPRWFCHKAMLVVDTTSMASVGLLLLSCFSLILLVVWQSWYPAKCLDAMLIAVWFFFNIISYVALALVHYAIRLLSAFRFFGPLQSCCCYSDLGAISVIERMV